MLEIGQLRDLGISDDRAGLLVRQGRFVRRHRGVYLDALARPTRRADLLAAQFALGDGSYLSGRTSLALAGVRAHNAREIHVTVVAEHTARHRGLRTHRTSVRPADDELQTRDGLRHSAPALALVEVAATETDAELDFEWPDHWLVVETDGDPYHLIPADRERDLVKDAWLQARGYRVPRISSLRFEHDRAGILADIRALISAPAPSAPPDASPTLARR